MENNYTLGRGKLYFSRLLAGGKYDPERYLGNTPGMSATIESETLDHYNSDEGVKEKDASVLLTTNRSGSFTTDNIDVNNVSLFFLGEVSTITHAGATVTDEVVGKVLQGRSYQLGITPSNPVGVQGLEGAVTVKSNNIELDAGTDFVIDMDLARIDLLEGGKSVEGDDLKVSYKTKVSTRERIISGSNPIEGRLRYIEHNPVGKNKVWMFPSVKLSPNGDYALKGDEWQEIPFSIEILKAANLAAIYIDGRATSS